MCYCGQPTSFGRQFSSCDVSEPRQPGVIQEESQHNGYVCCSSTAPLPHGALPIHDRDRVSFPSHIDRRSRVSVRGVEEKVGNKMDYIAIIIPSKFEAKPERCS